MDVQGVDGGSGQPHGQLSEEDSEGAMVGLLSLPHTHRVDNETSIMPGGALCPCDKQAWHEVWDRADLSRRYPPVVGISGCVGSYCSGSGVCGKGRGDRFHLEVDDNDFHVVDEGCVDLDHVALAGVQ